MWLIGLAVVLVLGLAAQPVEAQQAPKLTKIGLLTPSSPAGSGHLVEAFRQGLQAAGAAKGSSPGLSRVAFLWNPTRQRSTWTAVVSCPIDRAFPTCSAERPSTWTRS